MPGAALWVEIFAFLGRKINTYFGTNRAQNFTKSVSWSCLTKKKLEKSFNKLSKKLHQLRPHIDKLILSTTKFFGPNMHAN